MRGEFLQPDIVIVQQAVLGVVDIDAGRDVHGVDEAKPLLHAALAHELGDGVGDVEIIPPMRRLEPEMFGEVFHSAESLTTACRAEASSEGGPNEERAGVRSRI